MDKHLTAFFNGETTVVMLGKGTMLVKEPTPNGCFRMVLKLIENDAEIMQEWQNPNKPKTKGPPKNTGGKKPYIMLMVDEIEALKKKGVKNVEELIGYLVCLGKYAEWSTGKLIQKRSKKSLLYKDILKIYGCGNKKLNRLLSEMDEYDLLFKTKEGYFISQRFIKKGKMNKGGQ